MAARSKFTFEGQPVSLREMERRVPAYGKDKLQRALEAGCQTVPELMEFLARDDNRGRASWRAGIKDNRLPTISYGQPAIKPET